MSTLRTEGIVKDYPGTRALDDVTVFFDSGKVHVFTGKSGLEKSTLVRVSADVIQPTSGYFYLDEEGLHFSIPVRALNKGIAAVYQEPGLTPYLSVTENIFLGRLPKKGHLVNWKRTYQMAGELLHAIGIDVGPHEEMFRLSVWQYQMAEITETMSFRPKMLMLDEPTSALTTNETQKLFEAIQMLKKQNMITICISYGLQKLWEITDSVTVLRDGKHTGTEPISPLQHENIATMMFGDMEVKEKPGDPKVQDGTTMDVKHLTRKGEFQDVSFQLRKGGVLGIAGMLRSGRIELLRYIFDTDPYDSGEILVNQKTTPRNAGPAGMTQMGLGLTLEERKTQRVILIHSIRDNLCHASMDKMTQRHVINEKTRREFSKRRIRDLQIKVPDLMVPVSSFSGGSQRKVIIGDWLNTAPEIMVYDGPSRGISVKTKQQISQIMWEQSRKGIPSIFVSSEPKELVEVCHRILIMHMGKTVREVCLDDHMTIDALYAYCMGGKVE